MIALPAQRCGQRTQAVTQKGRQQQHPACKKPGGRKTAQRDQIAPRAGLDAKHGCCRRDQRQLQLKSSLADSLGFGHHGAPPPPQFQRDEIGLGMAGNQELVIAQGDQIDLADQATAGIAQLRPGRLERKMPCGIAPKQSADPVPHLCALRPSRIRERMPARYIRRVGHCPCCRVSGRRMAAANRRD